ncbi:ABC transporter substrate-binding protein [Fimbriimonas ginsengisoli]|uniref:Vitamin B12 ABC transporter, B12-binding component BtuF n=1 Tax=Fimbriimonas ginsengisoli Gsoil 348 TaxID=661478 RepID=A0A068NIS9_FIMGI|nr:ABC transporter substrate-binding protein [Fimbriimonas ginsengisoli]AIE83498.1 Vitamin B12 ABC transporter, B12-binding component BtuF [Fimbriimonas ginsengisoli Gsoil 348]
MRRAASLLLLFAFVFGLTGCRQDDNSVALKVRPKRYSKVVSLSPGTTELLMAGLSMYDLKGRTAYDDWPKMSVDKVPVVASVKPDYEKLAALRPDLIVYDASLFNEQDLAKLKTLGADEFKIDANDLDTFRKQVFELGSLTGKETSASDYIDKIYIAQNTAQGALPTPKPRVAVMMPSASGDHYIAGTDSFDANMIRAVGGEPIGPAGTTFVKANPESLVALNPDVIVVGVAKKDQSGVVALLNDPRIKSINAIKNRKIRALDADVLLRRGSRVDLLISGLYRAISG